jgi:enoyl-CoA hydratase
MTLPWSPEPGPADRPLADSPSVRAFAAGPVATITLNRPAALNALNLEVLEEIATAADRIAADDDDLRVVVLTGSGRYAFSIGADPGETLATLPPLAATDAVLLGERLARAQDAVRAIERLPVPVICAIGGHAIGSGLQLALACDFRFAVNRAKFAMPEVAIGLNPELGSTRRLVNTIGLPAARDLILTGRTVGGDEALRLGLIDRLCPDAEALRSEVSALISNLTANAPLAVRGATALLRSLAAPTAADLREERQRAAECLLSDDAREGFLARLEDRRPRFAGQ